MSGRSFQLRVALALGLAAIVLALAPGVADATTPGQLTQLASPFGCLTSDAALTTCTQLDYNAFTEPLDVAVSPDGLNAYEADFVNNSVDAFARNPTTGALTPLLGTAACIGPSSPCAPGDGLVGASAVVVSPDGANVYVASADGVGDDASIAEFTRDPTTGALTEVGCVADASIGSCTTGATGIGAPTSIAISPDGETVYVVGQYDQAVAAFSRDLSAPGLLTQLATPYDCVTSAGGGCGTTGVSGLVNAENVTVSPDGRSVYVTAGGGFGGGDIVEFARTEGTAGPPPPAGALTDIDCIASSGGPGCGTSNAVGIDGANGVSVSPDGASVYVTSQENDAVVEFSRDGNSGDLTQLAAPNDCMTSDPSGCGTDNATGLSGAQGVAVSPDDGSVYVTGTGDNAAAAFSRDPNSGDLTQLGRPADCVTSNGSGCGTTSAVAITDPGALVVSPDNGDVYLASTDGGSSALVALARAPITPPAGALTQLLEPNNCVGIADGLSDNAGGSVPFGSVGCDTLLSTGATSQSTVDVALSPDGKNAYEVLNDNELVELQRDPTTGALSYLGCITQASGCTINGAPGMSGPTAVAVSRDGRNVYVTGASDDAVAEFSRDPSDGSLTQLGGSGACISEVGNVDGSCDANDTGYGLDNGAGLVVSADGENVYVLGAGDDAVAELTRNPSTGALSPASSPDSACISDGTVISPSACTNTAVGLGLDGGPTQTGAAIAISPNGTSVYVAAGGFNGNGDIAEFSRDPANGVLTQLSGANACVTSEAADTGCPADNAANVNGPNAIAITPDGANVYVADQGASAVLELSRASSGALTQLSAPNQCIGGGCTTGANGMTEDLGVAVSPDELSVYAIGADDNAIAVLDRDPVSGVLSQPPFPYDCLSSLYGFATGCGTVNSAGFAGGVRVTVSGDGSDVYEAAQSLPALVELSRQPPSADLVVTASGTPGSALIGATLTDTYTVTDNGPSPVENSVLTATLPVEETLSAVSPSQGSCTGSGPISCNLGPLEAGHAATVTVTTTAATSGDATEGATVANVSDVTDPDAANNSAHSSTAISTTILPPPRLDHTTNIAPVAGTVLVRLPGSTHFVPLPEAEQIPFGSAIDTTAGEVSITVALPNGTTETGDFYDGEFVVTQAPNGRVTARLIGGSYAGCPVVHPKKKPRHGARIAAHRKSPHAVVRQLWGNAHGAFTTRGRYGAAAVRGTIWLTQDRCDGTYFHVTKDSITVTAYAHPKKHRLLPQGHHYLVAAGG